MYKSHRGDRRESKYTCTPAGVDPQVLDHPLESSGTIVKNIAPCPKPTDWISIMSRLIQEHQLIFWIQMRLDKPLP